MKKTLTAIALFAALATGATTANAMTMPPHAGHNEGLQNYYYYFGAPCCDRPMAMNAPCAAPVATACGECPAQYAPVEYEQVCTTCNPCGGGFSIFNPFTYFG